LLVLSACKPPSAPPEKSTPTPRPTATPCLSPTPTPIPVIDRKRMDVSRLFSDMQVVTRIEATRSPETASIDRKQPASYRLELTVHADVPAPSRTIEQITRNDPTLPAALAGLADRLATARISPFFEQFHALKLDYLKSRLSRIDTLLSLHNFYDLETALELQNPATGARALLLQGDMDVNTDGSDGDRNFPIDARSPYFQPQTSFRWKRLTERPNPLLDATTNKLARLKQEFAIPGLNAERNAELRDAIANTQATLYEIQHYSFLISGADPYIVLPATLLREKGPFAASIGDYAVVIHKGVAYPALVGDAGPSFKFGEASVRLCKQINARSSANNRPESDLKVTYLVFPGSKDASAGPPDLEKWRARCAALLTGLGLPATNLFSWENLIRPWPTPTPTPTPPPPPTPSASPIPTITPSPSVAPAPVTSPLASPNPISTPAPAA
jgi:hypothetical protein